MLSVLNEAINRHLMLHNIDIKSCIIFYNAECICVMLYCVITMALWASTTHSICLCHGCRFGILAIDLAKKQPVTASFENMIVTVL